MVRMCRDGFRRTSLGTPGIVAILLTSVVAATAAAGRDGYYGKFIGKLTEFHHGVSGEVYAVDARTLHLRNFNYDGEGPAAYFYVGNSKGPGVNGIRIRDERGTTNVLPKYRNSHITLTLPEGKTLQNIRWFSVWCDEFSVNFGDVRINKNFDFPRPQKISGLSGVHGVSSDPIVIVDAQTLLIPNFSYDGEAPDAKFWVGRGFKPSPQGIRLPDENGKYQPLRLYDRKTIVLTLPGDLTVFDIGHFGVWCEAFTVDFGHVQIPSGLNVPPSLKMLGVSPQKRSRSLAVPLSAQNQFGSPELGEQSLNNPIFYQDFKSQTNTIQDVRPTTYRPQLFRPVQQRGNSENFQIQRSISLSSSNEFVINEQTGDFVRKPLELQHSRREEVRYEPTPAEKILQHNPAEPGSQAAHHSNGFPYAPQTVQLQPRPVFVGPAIAPVQQQQQRQILSQTPVNYQPIPIADGQQFVRHQQPQQQFIHPQQQQQQLFHPLQQQSIVPPPQQQQIIHSQQQITHSQQQIIHPQPPQQIIHPQQIIPPQQPHFIPQQTSQVLQPPTGFLPKPGQFVQQQPHQILPQQQSPPPAHHFVHQQHFFQNQRQQQQPSPPQLFQQQPHQFVQQQHHQQPGHVFQRRSSQHFGLVFQQQNVHQFPGHVNRFDFNQRGGPHFHRRF